MKEVVNVNIGRQAFILDEDAYAELKNYFDQIKCHLPEGDGETIADVEQRIAEIFRERVNSPMLVVSIDMVRAAMAQMGSPADFGELRHDAGTATGEAESEPPRRRLYRSVRNRSIAGVCGGLADFFGIDATLLRLITLFLIIFGGLSIWVYIILWIIIPDEPRRTFAQNSQNR